MHEYPAGSELEVFDPLSQGTYYHGNDEETPSLYTICMRTVRKSLGLKRLMQADTLDLPRLIIAEIKQLGILDFTVDPGSITDVHHQEKTYPAICRIDDSKVYVQIIQAPDSDCPSDDPAYITSIPCQGMTCHVFLRTLTILDLVQRARHTQVSFSESFIWRVVSQMATLAFWLPAPVLLHPRDLHLLSRGERGEEVFYRPPPTPPPGGGVLSRMSPGGAGGVYAAPEVLLQRAPGEPAMVWGVGAITHELATLSPAFSPRNGDVMGVVTGILQGDPPPVIPPGTGYSPRLARFIQDAMRKEEAERPSLLDIIDLADTTEEGGDEEAEEGEDTNKK